MTKEELKKAMTEAGMDAAALATVDALDVSADVERLTGELTAEKGKNAQIVADKNKYKTERDEAKTALEAVKSENLTGDEKMQKQIDELTQKMADKDLELEEKDKLAAETARESEIMKIAATIKTIDGVDRSAVNLLVKNAMADIEDFGATDKVDAAVNTFKENNKALIAATVPEGSGGQHKAGGGGESKAPTLLDAVMESCNR